MDFLPKKWGFICENHPKTEVHFFHYLTPLRAKGEAAAVEPQTSTGLRGGIDREENIFLGQRHV